VINHAQLTSLHIRNRLWIQRHRKHCKTCM
jgi:hypothetical protein